MRERLTMTMKTTDWQKLAVSEPNDALAAKVANAKGANYNPNIQYNKPHFANQPPLLPENALTAINQQFYKQLVGKTVGRFTVIGYAKDDQLLSEDNQRWVVKCTCSHYEYRRTAELILIEPDHNNLDYMCQNCRHWEETKASYNEKPERHIDEEPDIKVVDDPQNDSDETESEQLDEDKDMSATEAVSMTVSILEEKREEINASIAELETEREELNNTIQYIQSKIQKTNGHDKEPGLLRLPAPTDTSPKRPVLKAKGSKNNGTRIIDYVVRAMSKTDVAMNAAQIHDIIKDDMSFPYIPKEKIGQALTSHGREVGLGKVGRGIYHLPAAKN